jgi:hypothetical protein
MLHPDAGGSRLLKEFNPNHDPHNGQFASVAGGGLARALSLIKASPEFNVRKVARAMGPAFQDTLSHIIEQTPQAHQALEAGLSDIVGKLGGQMVGNYRYVLEGQGIRGVMGPDKTDRRIAEKAIIEYDGDLKGVRDVVRSTIVVDTITDVEKVKSAITDRFTLTRPPKDRFTNPTAEGYRDYLLNVQLPNGMEGEIQLHLRPMLKAKESPEGHALYAQFRRAVGDSKTRAKLALRMAAVYAAAWSVVLATGGTR